jgi:hypothetical protein
MGDEKKGCWRSAKEIVSIKTPNSAHCLPSFCHPTELGSAPSTCLLLLGNFLSSFPFIIKCRHNDIVSLSSSVPFFSLQRVHRKFCFLIKKGSNSHAKLESHGKNIHLGNKNTKRQREWNEKHNKNV